VISSAPTFLCDAPCDRVLTTEGCTFLVICRHHFQTHKGKNISQKLRHFLLLQWQSVRDSASVETARTNNLRCYVYDHYYLLRHWYCFPMWVCVCVIKETPTVPGTTFLIFCQLFGLWTDFAASMHSTKLYRCKEPEAAASGSICRPSLKIEQGRQKQRG